MARLLYSVSCEQQTDATDWRKQKGIEMGNFELAPEMDQDARLDALGGMILSRYVRVGMTGLREEFMARIPIVGPGRSTEFSWWESPAFDSAEMAADYAIRHCSFDLRQHIK